MSRPTEAGEQQALMDWARWWAHPGEYAGLAFVFHVPNGEDRHPAVAAKLQRMGVVAGVADLLWLCVGTVPGTDQRRHFLALEMKGHRGRQSPEQAAFEEWVTANAGHYAIARSAGEAAVILCQWAEWGGAILESAEGLDSGLTPREGGGNV